MLLSGNVPLMQDPASRYEISFSHRRVLVFSCEILIFAGTVVGKGGRIGIIGLGDPFWLLRLVEGVQIRRNGGSLTELVGYMSGLARAFILKWGRFVAHQPLGPLLLGCHYLVVFHHLVEFSLRVEKVVFGPACGLGGLLCAFVAGFVAFELPCSRPNRYCSKRLVSRLQTH